MMGREVGESSFLSGLSPGRNEAWRALCAPSLPTSRTDLRQPWGVVPEE